MIVITLRPELKRCKTAVFSPTSTLPSVDGFQRKITLSNKIRNNADLAFLLYKQGIELLTPNKKPAVEIDKDWVFEGSPQGVEHALSLGCQLAICNFITHEKSPVTRLLQKGCYFVGQDPQSVFQYTDKWHTSLLFNKYKLPIPKQCLVTLENNVLYENESPFTKSTMSECDLHFPCVVKPKQGSRSEGVRLINNIEDLNIHITHCHRLNLGDKYIIQEYLDDIELNVFSVPYNNYPFYPPVKKLVYEKGIATKGNETIEIIENFKEDPHLIEIMEHCIHAAKLINSKLPIKFDIRKKKGESEYKIIDHSVKVDFKFSNVRYVTGENSSKLIKSLYSIKYQDEDIVNLLVNHAWHLV